MKFYLKQSCNPRAGLKVERCSEKLCLTPATLVVTGPRAGWSALNAYSTASGSESDSAETLPEVT